MKTQTLKTLDLKDLQPEKTLYIIGNGFDLAHGVQSKYSDFRKYIEINNKDLLDILEAYIRPHNDLWCDFERSLGNLDIKAMLKSSFNIYRERNDDDEYDENSDIPISLSIVEGFSPAYCILNDLPAIFSEWINSLKCKSIKRPFDKIILSDAKFLNFNYTDFIENLYSVKKENITYIHGCRKHDDDLILGHSLNISAYDIEKYLDEENLKMFATLAITQLDWIDEVLTKNTKKIIKENESYFKSLSNIESVFILGHSLSDVDYPYFEEIINANKDKNKVKWYISCYTENDISKAKKFIQHIDIDEKNVNLFNI